MRIAKVLDVFREGGHSHKISDGYLLACLRYIELIPVRAVMVD